MGPNSADGDGYSIVLNESDAHTDVNNAKYWHASKSIHGSPGRNDDVTVVKESKILPSQFFLAQNYPNPFNPTTIINYKLRLTSYVQLSIYNILGQRVVTLVSERQPPGNYKIEWDASGFASGVYYYEIKAGEIHLAKKMVLIR